MGKTWKDAQNARKEARRIRDTREGKRFEHRALNPMQQYEAEQQEAFDEWLNFEHDMAIEMGEEV
jgi:hypothetical protein